MPWLITLIFFWNETYFSNSPRHLSCSQLCYKALVIELAITTTLSFRFLLYKFFPLQTPIARDSFLLFTSHFKYYCIWLKKFTKIIWCILKFSDLLFMKVKTTVKKKSPTYLPTPTEWPPTVHWPVTGSPIGDRLLSDYTRSFSRIKAPAQWWNIQWTTFPDYRRWKLTDYQRRVTDLLPIICYWIGEPWTKLC